MTKLFVFSQSKSNPETDGSQFASLMANNSYPETRSDENQTVSSLDPSMEARQNKASNFGAFQEVIMN